VSTLKAGRVRSEKRAWVTVIWVVVRTAHVENAVARNALPACPHSEARDGAPGNQPVKNWRMREWNGDVCSFLYTPEAIWIHAPNNPYLNVVPPNFQTAVVRCTVTTPTRFPVMYVPEATCKSATWRNRPVRSSTREEHHCASTARRGRIFLHPSQVWIRAARASNCPPHHQGPACHSPGQIPVNLRGVTTHDRCAVGPPQSPSLLTYSRLALLAVFENSVHGGKSELTAFGKFRKNR
jgi:hypothetical protein